MSQRQAAPYCANDVMWNQSLDGSVRGPRLPESDQVTAEQMISTVKKQTLMVVKGQRL